MPFENKWLEWAKELQFLSQCALTYCKDKYDIERFQRIRDISAEMAADLTELPVEKVKGLFCADSGYQTSKLDTRAAVFRDGKLLLVLENGGRWALPGGWVDYNLTIRENTIKEVLEEAGMTVNPVRLIALHEHNRRNPVNPHPFNICSAFVMCEYISGAFKPNPETVGCDFFPLNGIPLLLSEGKTTREQIAMCFRASADPYWQPEFD